MFAKVSFGADQGSVRRMNTYVNGEPCATISKGVFDIPNSRFALSADSLNLFQSSRSEFQPGIRIRYVEVQIGAASKEVSLLDKLKVHHIENIHRK